jgi:hypothetical protein
LPEAYVQKNSGVKQFCAWPIWQDMAMAEKRSPPATNFRRNILALMEKHGDTTASLEEKTTMKQRAIYNVIYTEQKISLEQAEILASVYGYTGWQMIMPELPPNPQGANLVLEAYCKGTDEDRAFIELASSRTSTKN